MSVCRCVSKKMSGDVADIKIALERERSEEIREKQSTSCTPLGFIYGLMRRRQNIQICVGMDFAGEP